MNHQSLYDITLFMYILTHQNYCTAPLNRIHMLSCIRDQHWPYKPHRLPHHVFDNRGHRMQCKSPPWEPWISLPGLRGGRLRGAAGLYQPIQTQLTSRPTILFAGCICWVGDLSLEGQMLIFLMWHISESNDRDHWEGEKLCCISRLWVSSLPVFYM